MYLGPSTGGDAGDYLVVYLTANGSVALQFNLGGGDPLFEGKGMTTGVYSDGSIHHVLVQRTQNEAVLSVDEVRTLVTAKGIHPQPYNQHHTY